MFYRFYEDFFVLQSHLENWENDGMNEELKSTVDQLIVKYLIEAIPMPTILEFKKADLNMLYENIMSLDLFVIFRKIHVATYPFEKIIKDANKETITVNGVTLYKGKINQDGHFNGNGHLYSTLGENGNRFEGYFQNGIAKSGKRIANFAEKFNYNLFYEYNWETNERKLGSVRIGMINNSEESLVISGKLINGKLYDGYDTRYSSSGKLMYQGQVLEGLRHGKGTSYVNNKISFSGIWENDFRKDGIFI